MFKIVRFRVYSLGGRRKNLWNLKVIRTNLKFLQFRSWPVDTIAVWRRQREGNPRCELKLKKSDIPRWKFGQNLKYDGDLDKWNSNVQIFGADPVERKKEICGWKYGENNEIFVWDYLELFTWFIPVNSAEDTSSQEMGTELNGHYPQIVFWQQVKQIIPLI